MNDRTPVTTYLADDERIQVTKFDPNKNDPIPPYMLLGRPGTSRFKIDGFDTIGALSKCSPTAIWFFLLLASCRDIETNLCRDSIDFTLTKTERSRLARAYKELSGKSLVVRPHNKQYRINPKALLPKPACFEKIWDAWVDECAKKGIRPE